jgi:tricorn protease
MKRIILVLIWINLTLNLYPQGEALWLRYPSISPDGEKIAFTYKGDIYIVSSSGGSAFPLTFHEEHDFMPVWSNDGKNIAFASSRYGNFDVFLVPVEGGEPKRLTCHSSDEYPYSFSHGDSCVIFGGTRQDVSLHRQYPTESQPELYTVPVNGGKVSQLWTIPAEDIRISRNGNLFLYHDKKGGENAWRKHHTSSIARDIWIYDENTDNHRMITSFKGEDRNPVFSPDEKSIYYLTEESGSFNVYSLLIADPLKKEQVTNFKDYPVRFLSSSTSGILCFGYDGSIYTLKPGSQPEKLEIILQTAGKTN